MFNYIKSKLGIMSDVTTQDLDNGEETPKVNTTIKTRGKNWFLDEKNGVAVNLSEVATIDMRKKQLCLKSGKTISIKDGVLATQSEVLNKLFA